MFVLFVQSAIAGIPFHTLPLKDRLCLAPAAVEKEGAEADMLAVSGSAAASWGEDAPDAVLPLRFLEFVAQARHEECKATRCVPLRCQYQETRLPI